MRKSEVMQKFVQHFEQVSDSLSLVYSISGLDINGAQVDTDSASKILRLDFLWGEEERPYLDGNDGQHCTSIVQVGVHYPKANIYGCLTSAEGAFDSIPLDKWQGINIQNKTISQPLFDDDKVSHFVSFTIKTL